MKATLEMTHLTVRRILKACFAYAKKRIYKTMTEAETDAKLEHAVREGDISTIASIIDSGAAVNIFELIEIAVQHDRIDVFKHLLAYDNFIADVYHDSIETAAKSGSLNIIKYLLTLEDYDAYSDGVKYIIPYLSDDTILGILEYLESLNIDYYDERLPGRLARYGNVKSFIHLLPRVSDPNRYLPDAIIGGKLIIAKILYGLGAVIQPSFFTYYLVYSSPEMIRYLLSSGKITGETLEMVLEILLSLTDTLSDHSTTLEFIISMVEPSQESNPAHMLSVLPKLVASYY